MFLQVFTVRNLILLCTGLILPLLCARGSVNDSHFVPLVINTWAGNYEVATDKGVKTIDLQLAVLVK